MLYLKNESDAKDALQDIFLKIWEKKPVFQNEMHCRAWLIQTTKHHCLDLLKSSWFKKRVAYEPDDRGEKEKTQEDRLLEKIQMLPAKDREVLYLYYYEEYSIKEISQIIRRKESTILLLSRSPIIPTWKMYPSWHPSFAPASSFCPLSTV